ncbi:putative membrane protein [Oxalobacteraceae bacterium GrIS 1.11]
MHALRRFAHKRPRLVTALAVGSIVALCLPQQWQALTRGLMGWDIAIWSYLVLMGWLMMRASHARVRKIAEQEDKSAVMVLAILSIAAIVSLAAIVMELTTLKDLSFQQRLGHYIFTGVTVFGSWCMVATVFTIHYAYLFYRAPENLRPLCFPENEQQPDYWDFLYFSFTIAVAAQTSDVTVNSRAMRKTVLAQSILSFLFNTAILGLTINIAASIVGA